LLVRVKDNRIVYQLKLANNYSIIIFIGESDESSENKGGDVLTESRDQSGYLEQGLTWTFRL
jgi:hypothetical protein